MSEWDEKLLKYGELFETHMMDLSVNLPLEQALDRGWMILSICFDPQEVGIKTELIEKYWNREIKKAKDEGLEFNVTFPEKGSGGVYMSSFALERDEMDSDIPEQVNRNGRNTANEK